MVNALIEEIYRTRRVVDAEGAAIDAVSTSVTAKPADRGEVQIAAATLSIRAYTLYPCPAARLCRLATSATGDAARQAGTCSSPRPLNWLSYNSA
ncbi:MAG: hypothetical protein QOF51_2800 [Chloroflexota bacterium]|nr:hypothetical protein [Chloroflexota bacterium]